MNLNQVTLAGRLARDPQLKYLPSQTAVVDFGIAINRKWKTEKGEERDEATFVDVVAFGRVGEAINTFMRKGREILILGRLKFDSWEDKQSGQKRTKLSVVAESFQFVGPKPNDDGQPRDSAPRQPVKPKPQPSQSFDPTEDVEFAEPDIPF